MEITGVDYNFFTTISAFETEKAFIDEIKMRWKNPLIEEWERSDNIIELFFAKDQAMNRNHEKSGYSIDKWGEGCFLFTGVKMSFIDYEIKMLNKIFPNEQIKIMQYDSRLIGLGIWQYSLVLPGDIERNEFSSFVLKSLYKVLYRLCGIKV